MKTLRQHIDESLKIGKNLSEWSSYSCQPKTRSELKEIIKTRIKEQGPECDLNDIDVSQITDMYDLFYNSDFTGDISKWDVSNVTKMSSMFFLSKFNGDLSKWDVSSVTDMRWMFQNSKFNGDISQWNINKNCNTWFMFKDCPIKEEYKPKALQS